MITIDFVRLAMQTLLTDNKNFYLANGISKITEFGKKTLGWSISSDGATTVTAKTSTECYFDEASDNAAHTVNSLVSVPTGGSTVYYSLPLQNEVAVYPGYQLKINPYKENESNEHIRGIMVKFTIPTNEEV